MNPPKQHASTPADAAAANETSSVVRLRTVSRPAPASAALFLPHSTKDRFRFATFLESTAAAGPNARIRARPWLTDAEWTGNIDAAARVAAHLVDNALKHGTAFPDRLIPLRMIVLRETEELVIEVDDARRGFPDFERVAKQAAESKGQPSGLWWVDHYHADLSWAPKLNAGNKVIGKTVKATMPSNWEASA